ncbi:hypothetical protein [Bacteroides graminisolvens]|uniref:Uncharacterized protein n=1 Tax=Bacteroides graminisolvens DSM 19988 = JCM 15093 TaxID=1121097 RepID=A0A069D726_9BACE|nr:hypothetical protein [Bacteroides graminisolvens]GAK38165.1 hypothetical protein JCM15093_3481 [Bacteroides graminisolvens DSM 19988 = JCM 15093]
MTDYWGNNRVTDSDSIVQSNHHYPFGMSFVEGFATSQQLYKYNAKGLDTEDSIFMIIR